MTALRALPATAKPMDALRTAVSAWGATQDLPWPPTVEQARALTAFSPSALAAFARLRAGPGADRARSRRSTSSRASSTSSTASGRTPARPGRSTPTSSSAPSTASTPRRSRRASSPRPARDIASAVAGAIGALKGPLHGGAPSEVVDQLHQVGSPEHAEAVGPRRARPRRAADGLRPSRLPRLRPAGRRAAQGRRGDGRTSPTGSQLAIDGRGRRAPRPRREAPGARRSRPTSSTTPRPC